LAAGQLAGLAVQGDADPLQPAAGKGLVEAAVELVAYGEVLGGGEVLVQGDVLGDEADLGDQLRDPAGWSSTRIVPAVGASRLTARCSRVVLPAPLGPTRAAMRPWGTTRLQSLSAQVLRP
jgi:hypothetical protein